MKFAVYTKWYWKNSVPSPAELQANMNKSVSGDTTAEDVIWWKIDENHHQSLIIYPSEKIAEEEMAKRTQVFRMELFIVWPFETPEHEK